MKNRIILSGLAGTILALIVATTPVFALTLERQLDIGAQGDDVSALQTFLATDSSIYPEGLVTGYFGDLTSAAVARWQSANGIDAVGRVGPVTLAALNAATGGTVSAGTPSATSDGAAPIMSKEIVTLSANSAVITWTTNEPSENSVLYGSAWPFYLGTAPSASSATFSTSATVTLTGLMPNHTYYYVRQSVDAAGNVQYAINSTFTTNAQ